MNDDNLNRVGKNQNATQDGIWKKKEEEKKYKFKTRSSG